MSVEFSPDEPITVSITVFDAAGNVVSHSEHVAGPEDMLSQSEIDDAVAMIESGMTAYDAVFLAKQMRDVPVIPL